MDNEYVDELRNELKGDEFTYIYPKDYALKLREKFKESPSLWYDVIIPKSKAAEFIKTTENDYSKIWHAHCYCCWKNIDINTEDICYVSSNQSIWLCRDCYKLLKNK